jgi:hypothetical protein
LLPDNELAIDDGAVIEPHRVAPDTDVDDPTRRPATTRRHSADVS